MDINYLQLKGIPLIGMPASGKGLLSDNLMATGRFNHLSSGNMLKEYSVSNTDWGNLVKEINLTGGLVDTETTFNVHDEYVPLAIQNKWYDLTKPILLDGLPRKMDQIDPVMLRYDVIGIVYMDMDFEKHKDILKQRIQNRARIQGRKDDAWETYQRRVDVYMNETQPILDFLPQKKIIRVDANQNPKKIFDYVISKIEF